VENVAESDNTARAASVGKIALGYIRAAFSQ
jgi:hypothetical protein